MYGPSGLLLVHEFLKLPFHDACWDVRGMEGIIKLGPQQLVVHGVSSGVVDPPRASIPQQLLCGEEGLMMFCTAEEPEFGLYGAQPMVSL
jgi:hypothetical protein